jgi:hypothetical protein
MRKGRSSPGASGFYISQEGTFRPTYRYNAQLKYYSKLTKTIHSISIECLRPNHTDTKTNKHEINMPPKNRIPLKQTNATKPPSTPSPPNWPPFKPFVPPSNLSLSTLVESQIVTISNFWTSTLCKSYVNFLKTLPLVTTPGTPKRGDALRVNDRFQIQDEQFANRLWEETGLRDLVCGGDDETEDGMSLEERRTLWLENLPDITLKCKTDGSRGGDVIGLNPNIRIYRYSKGQFFDCHCMSFYSVLVM